MKKFVLIVAGGKGSRMGNKVPKQFLELNGKPVIMHTIEKFFRFDPSIHVILVLPADQFQQWEHLCHKHVFHRNFELITGGTTRFESVKNGLSLINDEGIVFIHDGVRPLVSIKTIKNCLDTAIKYGCAIPVIPLADSIRQLTDKTNHAADRDQFRLVQTPQTFKVSLIKKAFQKAIGNHFTDDASVFEAAGHSVELVEGNSENIKITRLSDLKTANALLMEDE